MRPPTPEFWQCVKVLLLLMAGCWFFPDRANNYGRDPDEFSAPNDGTKSQ